MRKEKPTFFPGLKSQAFDYPQQVSNALKGEC